MKKTMFCMVVALVLLATFSVEAVSYSSSGWGNNIMTPSKELASIEKTLPSFRVLEIQGICNVEVRQDSKYSIEVKGAKNFIENLSYNVSGQTLSIKMKKNYMYKVKNKSEYLKIVVCVPDMIKLVKDNLGDVVVKGDINTDDLWIINSSMSALTLANIKCNSLKLELKSGGEVTVGNIDANNAFVRNSSMGKMRVGNINTDMLKVVVSSGGSVTINSIMAKSANFVNKSMGNINARTVECKSSCNIRLTSGGNFTADSVTAYELSCESSSMGKISIKKADSRRFIQNEKNGKVRINY